MYGDGNHKVEDVQLLEVEQVIRTGSWLIVRLERPDYPKRRKGGNARRNGGPQETTL